MKPKDENKIRQIYDATLELVNSTGLSGITMGDIAKRAGLATGTVYIYFSNKEELINKLYLECRQSSAKQYFKGYKESDSFEDAFKVIFYNIVKHRTKKFNEAIFMEQANHSPFVSPENLKVVRTYFKPLYKLVERGKKEKKLKDFNTISLLVFMVGSIHEMVKYHNYNKVRLTRKVIDHTYLMCVDGMK